MLGFNTAAPVTLVNVYVHIETIVIKTDTDIFEGLVIDTCRGVQYTARIIPYTGTEPVQAGVKQPLG